MSTRISDLPSASTVASADLVPIVQGGITKKATAGTVVSNLLPVASTSQPGIVQLGTGASNACQGNDARLSNSRTPTGTAGGDLIGTYPNPELIPLCTAGTYGASSAIPVLTLDAKGRVASISTEQIFVNADNITSGTLSPTRLANSGVANGTYGSSTQIPVLTLDAKGRVTIIETSQISVNAGNIITGILDPARLATSGVVAGTVGSSAQIPVLTIDAKGRIISAATAIPLPGNNASDLTTGTLNPALLATSGVAAGTFGSAGSVGQFTVDSKGRITSATEVGISGSAGGTVVAVGATSSTLQAVNGPVTYSGALQFELSTLPLPVLSAGSSTQSAVIGIDQYGRVTSLATQSIAALSPTGVTAGAYGHPDRVAQFDVNANGVITGASEAAIAISATAISGLAASATVDTTNAGNISTGVLNSARVPVISASQVASGITPAQVSGFAPSATTDTTNASNITSGLLSASRLPSTGVTPSSYGSATTVPVLLIDSTGRITSASTTPISATPTTVGYLKETTNAVSSSAAGVINFDIFTQPTIYYTAASTAAFTLNVRGDSSNTFNLNVSVGQAVTITFLNTNTTFAAPLSAFQVDGVTQSVRWQNGTGSIPTPNVNCIDAWTFTIIKTASSTYTVIGSLTRFS